MADYSSTFTEVDGVSSVEAADFSTEFDAIETAIATKVDTAELLTRTDSLNMKIVEIGDWDMDTNDSPSVAPPHGVSLSKIRSIEVMIRNDSNTRHYNYPSLYNVFIDSTVINLFRVTGSIFDSTSFSSTSFNRGWVTIKYTD